MSPMEVHLAGPASKPPPPEITVTCLTDCDCPDSMGCRSMTFWVEDFWMEKMRPVGYILRPIYRMTNTSLGGT
jgi:hypothetical protein